MAVLELESLYADHRSIINYAVACLPGARCSGSKQSGAAGLDRFLLVQFYGWHGGKGCNHAVSGDGSGDR